MEVECQVCGQWIGGSIVEPPTSDDPEAVRGQVAGLRRLLAALDRGEATPEQVATSLQQTCPLCRSTMEPLLGSEGRAELAGRLQSQIDLLSDRATALERRLNSPP